MPSFVGVRFLFEGVQERKGQPKRGNGGRGRRAQRPPKLSGKLTHRQIRRVGGVGVCARIEMVLLACFSRREGREEQKERDHAKDENVVAACVDVERRKIGLTEQTEEVVKGM